MQQLLCVRQGKKWHTPSYVTQQSSPSVLYVISSLFGENFELVYGIVKGSFT